MEERNSALRDDYGFDVPQAVLDRLKASGKRIRRIPESAVRDLTYAPRPKWGYRFVKRAVDICVSLIALIVLLIPMLIISMCIYINDPGSVLFTHYRVGMNAKQFQIYKFRTMYLNTPKYLATNDVRNPKQYITRVGRVLRKTSLDELPQLWNVLKGDMSIIGPRPLISDELEIHRMRVRFGAYNVRPGITGLAQINGRDLTSSADKIRWDVEYVHKFGPAIDMKILLSTIPQVFHGRDVVEGGKKVK